MSMKIRTMLGAIAAGALAFAGAAGAQNLTLAAGPSGGTWYPLGAALAKIIEEAVPGTKVSVVNGVTVANILGTNAGQYDLALSLSTSNSDAAAGAGDPFPAPQDKIRGVVGFYPAPYQMAVLAGSEIQSIEDFAGKVINPGVVGGATDVMTQKLLQLAGLDYDKMGRVERLSYSDASMQLKDGHLDVFTGIISVPAGAIAEAALGSGVRLIPVKQEMIETLQAENEGYVAIEIPAGTYKGQEAAALAIGTNNVLIANADLDADLVEKITGAIVARAEDLHDVNAALTSFTAESAPRGLGVAMHPGAKAYFDAN
jgi:hypothetical protein